MAVVYDSRISEILGALDGKLEKAAEAIGEAAETHAKLYITEGVYQSPQGWYVRTGALRDDITHAVEEADNGKTVAVGNNIFYAPYVELGTGVYAGGRQTPWSYKGSDGNWHTTSGMPPRPYLRPSIENHIPEYMGILEEILKE